MIRFRDIRERDKNKWVRGNDEASVLDMLNYRQLRNILGHNLLPGRAHTSNESMERLQEAQEHLKTEYKIWCTCELFWKER